MWHALVDGATTDDLRRLAVPIIQERGNVAVFVGRDGSASVLVARSEDVALDALAVAREAARPVGGGAGGKPDFAQGGGTNVERAQDALDIAVARVRSLLQE